MTFIKSFFSLLLQYFINWFNLFDHALNCLLLGDPNETLSARFARARAAGHSWAVVVCAILTWAAKIVTFGKYTRDHCAYALDPTALPDCAEIWSWSTNSIETTPVTEVDDVQVSQIMNAVSNTIVL